MGGTRHKTAVCRLRPKSDAVDPAGSVMPCHSLGSEVEEADDTAIASVRDLVGKGFCSSWW
jgi:hypothetical protein